MHGFILVLKRSMRKETINFYFDLNKNHHNE